MIWICFEFKMNLLWICFEFKMNLFAVDMARVECPVELVNQKNQYRCSMTSKTSVSSEDKFD